MGFPAIHPAIQFFDDSGNVLVSGLLYSYVPATTTPKTTYSDAALATPNANPIVLDGAGRCSLFLTDGELYKFVLKDEDGNTIWTRDNVKSPLSIDALTAEQFGTIFYGRSAAEIAASVTPTNYRYIWGDTRRYGTGSTALQRAVDQAAEGGSMPFVDFAVAITLTAGITLPEDGITLTINGTVTSSASIDDAFFVSGDRVTMQGCGTIDTNGCDFGVRVTGANFTISGITFKGNVLLSYVRGGGDYNTVEFVHILPGYDCSNIPIRMLGATGVPIKKPRVRFCLLEDVRGFNVQCMYCTDAEVLGNTFRNPTYFDNVTASGSQSAFTGINLEVDDIDRWGARVNGVQREISGIPTHTGGGLYSITLASAASDGQTVTFYGSRSLENIQFNSECNGGRAVSNDCDGTGDSNIIAVADFHDGNLGPGGIAHPDVDEDDFPKDIIVTNNTLRNAFASNVNMTHALGYLVDANDCASWGLKHDTSGGPYYCAIFVSRDNGRVGTNNIRCSGDATQYAYGGWNSIDSTDSGALDFSTEVPSKVFGTPNVIGVPTARYFFAPGSVTTERKYGIDCEESAWEDYPQDLQGLIDTAFTNFPVPTDYWDSQSASGATPVVRDTSIKQGGTASAQVQAGTSWQFKPLAYLILASSLVRISFWAKNNSANNCELRVHYDNGENDSEPHFKVTINSQTWKKYQLYFPISAFGSGQVFFRLQGHASGTANMEYFKLQSKKLSIV